MFENAYFGKPYKTEGGERAIYHSRGSKVEEEGDHLLIIENRYGYYHYDNSGKYYHLDRNLDIISEWQESLDEEKLDKQVVDIIYSVIDDFQDGEKISFNLLKEIAKAAYRKAMEDKK